MARLPVYNPQETVTAGTDTLRTLGNRGAVGVGLGGLGTAIENTAVTAARADSHIAAIEEADAKRVAGLGDALTREDMQTTWYAKQKDLEANIDPTAAGYTDAVTKAFDEHAKAYDAKFSDLRRGENQVLTGTFRSQVIKHAIDVEYQTRVQSQGAVAKKITDDTFATVSEAPNAFDTALKDAELRADVLGFQGKIKDRFMQDVRTAAELGRLDSKLKSDPASVLVVGQELFSGLAAHPEVRKIAAGAAASGTDVRLLTAIGLKESNLNPDARPISADPAKNVVQLADGRRAMSSAAGVFQLLDKSAYGKVDPKDTEGQARAVGMFLDKQKERLTEAGIDATPGKLYMFHNVGEGLAMNILRADPNESMGSIIARTYPSRPDVAAQVARNNPSLYNTGMTAGQVVANYEKVMAGKLAEADKALAGGVSGGSDAEVKAKLSDLLGVPVERIGAAEFKKAIDAGRAEFMKQAKDEFKLANGAAIHNGAIRVDPYDSESKKPLNAYAATTGVAEGMLKGDEAAFEAARASVRNANIVAQPYLNSSRELIVSGDASSPGKARAFQFLANIAKDNMVAWDASNVPEPVKDRIKMYRALTEGNDAIVSPGEAIKRITLLHSPAGDSAKQAAKDLFKANREAEIKALNVDDAVGAVSKGLWRNAEVFNESGAASDIRKRQLFRNYREAYEGYRIQGEDTEMSKKLALQDVADAYKVTNIFRGPLDRAEVTRYPMEAKYLPIDANAPYKWIEDQARSVVNAEYAARYGGPITEKDTFALRSGASLKREGDKPNLEIRVVPTDTTARDWNVQGREPRYDLMFRNPNTGLLELAYKDWSPNQADAQAAFDERVHTNASAEVRARENRIRSGIYSGPGR